MKNTTSATILPYQKKAIDHFNQFCDFKGKSILEIGAIPPFETAREFLNRGAQKVVCIDYRSNLKDGTILENLEFRNMDARDLKFDSKQFDLVFGVAVLEHLPNLDKVLSEIFRVLVKGGYTYLHGGPIWSCNLGHHVYLIVDKVSYFFNQNNPIPHWHHLLYTPQEMIAYLEAREIPSSHAQEIVRMVYESPTLNRYSFEDFLRFFKKTKLTLIELNQTPWGLPPEELRIRLKKINKNSNISFLRRLFPFQKERNFQTGEISVLFKK